MLKRTLFIACLVVAPAAAAPSVASAEKANGTSRVSLEGKGLKSLTSQGVKLSAKKPVRVSRSELVLPAASGTLGSKVRLDSKGSLTLRKGKRAYTLKGLRTTLAKRGSITGKVGKRTVTLFTVVPARRKAMRVNLATGRVTLQSARVSITRSAGRALRKALRLRRTPAGDLGTVTVVTTIARKSGSSAPGLPQGSVPAAAPMAGSEPPELARPATAVDVTPTGFEWNVRTSFINYVNTQSTPNGGSYPTGGATAGAAESRDNGPLLVYRFNYAPVRGWYDPASGRAALYFAGSVNFRFFAHGIDFDAKNPEIEINGAASRAIYRLDGRKSTPYGDKRGVLLDLEAGSTAGPRCVPAGKVVTCANIAARVPADAGQSIFAGFYQQGDEFGSITVSFTTP